MFQSVQDKVKFGRSRLKYVSRVVVRYLVNAAFDSRSFSQLKKKKRLTFLMNIFVRFSFILGAHVLFDNS